MKTIKLIGSAITLFSILELSWLILITDREKLKLDYKVSIVKVLIVLTVQTLSNWSLVNAFLIIYQGYIIYKYFDILFNTLILNVYESIKNIYVKRN